MCVQAGEDGDSEIKPVKDYEQDKLLFLQMNHQNAHGTIQKATCKI
jgi:hypothetical protein